jgi:hypothetical protein
MDNLSEYIPLLVIIASVVVSILRKTKQPAKEVAVPEDVFEPEEPQPYFVPEKPIAEEKPVTPVRRKIRMPAKKEPAGYKRTVEEPDVDEYEESINLDLSDREEIKKAIIYTEIFR